jgi:hypothetical protein
LLSTAVYQPLQMSSPTSSRDRTAFESVSHGNARNDSRWGMPPLYQHTWSAKRSVCFAP